MQIGSRGGTGTAEFTRPGVLTWVTMGLALLTLLAVLLFGIVGLSGNAPEDLAGVAAGFTPGEAAAKSGQSSGRSG